MKIKKGFVLRVVGGENVVVPVGEMSKKFHGMINLNETFLGHIVFTETVFPGVGRKLQVRTKHILICQNEAVRKIIGHVFENCFIIQDLFS